LGGTADIRAGNGGNATVLATAQAGGAGGTINRLTARGFSYSAILRDLVAGNGGNADNNANTAVGGVGGSVTNVNVQGNIGNFVSAIAYGVTDLGGVFAGVGGAGDLGAARNGSITFITATNIASLAANNGAMPAQADLIDRIVASIIGRDINGNLGFDFDDTPAGPGASNGLYDVGEVPTDGIVMARVLGSLRNALNQPVTPLFSFINGVRTGAQVPS
jgi:hypothetical protein